jgi:hypothetical protein
MSTQPATSGQARQSLLILEQAGLSADNYRTLHDGYLADLAQAAKAGALPDRQTFRTMLKLNAVMPETFRLTTDYSQPLEAMIACGHYDWKNDDITPKRFPLKGEGIVEVEACLFHFNREIESKDAIKAIESADKDNPWSASQIEHILAFGAFFPEEQRKFPIIGLGSVAEIRGDRYVPALWKLGSKRSLDLSWFGSRWFGHCRFLAVRKVSAT